MDRYKSLYEQGKDSLPTLTCEVLQIEDYLFFVYYTESDPGTKQALLEAKQKGAISLGGSYSATKHKPHTPKGEYHVHIYDGQNQIGSINMSGTTHDSHHGVQLPRTVVPALQKAFPKFTIPETGLLENAFEINPMLNYYKEDINTLAQHRKKLIFG